MNEIYIPKGPRRQTAADCKDRPQQRPPCKVCALIRVYLMFAVPLIFMVFAGVEIDWPEINMTALVGYLFLIALVLRICWRVYVDYVQKN